jgi:hypothetical protein
LAKASDDKHTLELPGLPVAKRMGRPASGKAKTAAQRVADLRARRKQEAAQATANLAAASGNLEAIRADMLRFGSPALISSEVMLQAWEDWYRRMHDALYALEAVKTALRAQNGVGKG